MGFRGGSPGLTASQGSAPIPALYTGYRSMPTNMKMYRNNIAIGAIATNDSTSPLSTAIHIGAGNGSGTSNLIAKYSFSAIHVLNSDAQVASLYNRVQQLQQDLGRAV